MSECKECRGCKGTGITVREAFSYEGRSYPRQERPCFSCDGRGNFTTPDYAGIIQEIKGRKGLRSARPKSNRAYYVWRMARFHGGADVTMPICAMTDVRNDPFVPELDKLADLVAQRVFGSHMAAAHRWGRALGYLDRDMPGLPASAYSGGPVADTDKPIEELAELM